MEAYGAARVGVGGFRAAAEVRRKRASGRKGSERVSPATRALQDAADRVSMTVVTRSGRTMSRVALVREGSVWKEGWWRLHASVDTGYDVARIAEVRALQPFNDGAERSRVNGELDQERLKHSARVAGQEQPEEVGEPSVWGGGGGGSGPQSVGQSSRRRGGDRVVAVRPVSVIHGGSRARCWGEVAARGTARMVRATSGREASTPPSRSRRRKGAVSSES